ncbi:MAG: hypothetical protein AAF346_01990 [Pseudomonadota bacterium]
MSWNLSLKCAVGMIVAFMLLLPRASWASEPALGLELNSLSRAEGACRISFVAQNKMGSLIEELKLELVLFGKDGQVDRLLAVNVGRMPKDKTRVKQFDLKSTNCDDIGRLLLNNITQCKGPEVTPTKCLDAVKPTSRLSVSFSY